MSHSQYLREILRPLGIYNLEGTFNGGELDAQGAKLDEVMAVLEKAAQEVFLDTAEDWGLERRAQLFQRRPVASQPRPLGRALAALLRIGGDSFTLSAINDTILGCGIPAKVEELGGAVVAVSFPGVAGEPPGFDDLKQIIEDILPPHLEIQYHFWYLTWRELEEKFSSWQAIEKRELTWEGLETCVT